MAGGVNAAPSGGSTMTTSAAAMFQVADADGNGVVTKEELANFIRSQSQIGQNFPVPDGVQTEPISPGAASSSQQGSMSAVGVIQYHPGSEHQYHQEAQPPYSGRGWTSERDMEPPLLPVFTQTDASNWQQANGGDSSNEDCETSSAARAAAMVFAAMDRNSDGVVTKEEFQQFVADAASGNTSGISSFAPLLACTAAESGTPLLQVTSASLRGSASGTGTVPKLTPAAATRTPPTTIQSRPVASYRLIPVPAQAPAVAPTAANDLFDGLDQNHDGVITQAEFAQAMYSRPVNTLPASSIPMAVPPPPYASQYASYPRHMELKPPEVIPPPLSSHNGHGGMLACSKDHPGGDIFAPFKDEVGTPDLVFASTPVPAQPPHFHVSRVAPVNSSPAMLPPMHLSSAEVKYSYSQPAAPPASAPEQYLPSVNIDHTAGYARGRGLLTAGSEHPGGDLFTIFGGGEVDVPSHPLDFAMQDPNAPEKVTVELVPLGNTGSSRAGLLANAAEHPGGDLFTSFVRPRAPKAESYTFIKTTPPNMVQHAAPVGIGFLPRSAPATAVPPSPVPVVHANDLFSQLDRNNDGVITRDEIQAALEGQASHPWQGMPQGARTVPGTWHHTSPATQYAGGQYATFQWR